ncbi:Nucleotide-binding oligomerization domain-containing protein 1 [Hondaea fermentalgiana]|uniref:Nucleotide-binding oligomerization domain-containing protein 1 n=1 Tax=Hondaea fermentalgiana TaxID=2315210 RepID=A0A2R5GSS0_9STRA|nr:Nucleotide-binding oligomerization domain-containing protein 1 [Hondaea fermentalgiana]|eukprot:GBG32808.1 Nucleotide-binding oligomerization domain-containing protein 1 [Hondaea fermentalgiana]
MDIDEPLALEPPKQRTAKGLSRDDTRRELQSRDIQPLGILAEDENALQDAFDREFVQDLERYNAAQRERAQRIVEEQERLREEQRKLANEREDQQLVAKDGKLRLFLKLAKENRSASEATFIGGAPMGRVLAAALPGCTSLVALDLSNGSIGNEGTRALGAALARGDTLLQRLELARTCVGPEGLAALGMGLVDNSHLVTLGLEDNNLTDDGHDFGGVDALSEALLANKTLTCLNLARTNLGQRGVAALARTVCKNETIRSLDIEFNGMPLQSDVDVILQTLDDNKALYLDRQVELHAELRVQRQQQAIIDLENAREQKVVEEELAAEARAQERHKERMRKFLQEREQREKELEDARERAHERHAIFVETELNAKKKGKKK